MTTYYPPFTLDFQTSFITIDSGVISIDCFDLYTAIKLAQSDEEGILYEQIAKGSGLNDLGDNVKVGLTVELLGDWQIRFPEGNYIAKISGGNLIGGPLGDPIAYSAGVQTLLIQSAAATIVTTGSGTGGATIEEIERSGGLLDKTHKNTVLIPASI